jgi:hypothetical protein
LLVLAVTSLYYARRFEFQARESEASLEALRTDVGRVERLAARVEELAQARGGDPYAGRPLDSNLAAAVNQLLAQRAQTGVVLEQIALIGGPPSGNSLTPLREFARPLPLTGGQVRTASLRVKGTYADYEGFRAYLSGLRGLPASLSSLSASGRTFEAILTVYGV